MDLPTSPKKPSYIQSKQRKQALIAAPKEISLEAKQIFKPCLDINNISLQAHRGISCTICVHTLPSRNWPRIFKDRHHKQELSRPWSAAEKPKICEQNFWQRSLAGWQVGGRLQTTGFKAILKTQLCQHCSPAVAGWWGYYKKIATNKETDKKVRVWSSICLMRDMRLGRFLETKSPRSQRSLRQAQQDIDSTSGKKCVRTTESTATW